MPICTLSFEQLDEFLKHNEIVFIDFWASWCAPCLQFSKVYEQVADENPTIQFTKVNIEQEVELANSLEIRSIPYLMIFKQGILIYSEAGAMPESVLNDLVQQAISVDVSAIATKLDEES